MGYMKKQREMQVDTQIYKEDVTYRPSQDSSQFDVILIIISHSFECFNSDYE